VDLAAKKKEETKKKPAESPFLQALQDALKKAPSDKVKEATKRVEGLTKENAAWADLFALPAEKLEEMSRIGYEQFKSGGYQSSEKIFRGLTVLDPENYYYHQMLGATYQRMEKFAESVLEYSIALDLNDKDIVSYTNRGESYLKLGLHPLAAQDFEKAISLDKTGEDRWANRARMLKEQVRLMGQKKGQPKKK